MCIFIDRGRRNRPTLLEKEKMNRGLEMSLIKTDKTCTRSSDLLLLAVPPAIARRIPPFFPLCSVSLCANLSFWGRRPGNFGGGSTSYDASFIKVNYYAFRIAALGEHSSGQFKRSPCTWHWLVVCLNITLALEFFGFRILLLAAVFLEDFPCDLNHPSQVLNPPRVAIPQEQSF